MIRYILLLVVFAYVTVFSQMVLAEEIEMSAQRVEIKASTLKVAQLREDAMVTATQNAFMLLLKRMTPRYVWDRHEMLLGAVDVNQFVTRTTLVEENRENGRYVLVADISFDKGQLKDVLKEKGIPFSEKEIQKTLVIALYENLYGQKMLWENENIWKAALVDDAKEAGFQEMIFPMGDMQEVSKLTPQAVALGAGDVLLDVARNYDASVVVVAQLRSREGFIGRVMDIEGQVYNVSGEKNSFYARLPYAENAVEGDMVQEAARIFYNRLFEDQAQGSLVDVDKPGRIFLRYHPEKLDDLVVIEKNLTSLDRLKALELRVISLTDVIYQADFFGEKEAFKETLKSVGFRVIETSLPTVWGISL